MWTEGGQRYTASINANEKSHVILNSLACFQREVWCWPGTLDMALDETSGVRKQDGYRWSPGSARTLWAATWHGTGSGTTGKQDQQLLGHRHQLQCGQDDSVVAGDFNTELELGELETSSGRTMRSWAAQAAANTMVESTKAITDWIGQTLPDHRGLA